MPVYNYEYPAVKMDSAYIWRLMQRRTGKSVIGITETPEKIVVAFEAELTPAEKAELDVVMASPPTPVRYEIALLTPEYVEAEVGVKPVRADIDPATGLGTVDFDRDLTPGEVGRLEACLAKLRRFRKR